MIGVFWALPAHGVDMTWSGIRDGRLYLLPKQVDSVQLDWKPAWQADANREKIHLVDGAGRLTDLLDIPPDQISGKHAFALKPSSTDYRLGIPGYSFRAYHITHDDAIAAQFEPAKVHFSMQAPQNLKLYFRVKAGAKAVLNGKYHDGGVSMLQATRLSDARLMSLSLQSYTQYSSFNQLPLPVSQQDEIWRLKLVGSGKAAFWLDGASNLFAQKPEHLHSVTYSPGTVELTLRDSELGLTPRLGGALPYTSPHSEREKLAIKKLGKFLGFQAAGFYSFVDVLSRKPKHETDFRSLYQNMGINFDLTLLSKTERNPILMRPPDTDPQTQDSADRAAQKPLGIALDADPQTRDGVNAWLADRIRLKSSDGLHYLALADEPNLNYPNYDDFMKYFIPTVQYVYAKSDARAAGVRIVAFSSSRFSGAPFLGDGSSSEDAKEQRGSEITKKLLESNYAKYIDAIAWHEWMVRDLFSTRRYREEVQAAANLVGLDANRRPRKALLIDQTNISSGNAVSPYQQKTHFAALWWASVAINASSDGLLDMLNWSPVIDNEGHTKGMVRSDWLPVVDSKENLESMTPKQGEVPVLKPVAFAQNFMSRHWLPRVLGLGNSAFEVDALFMHDGHQRYSLLGVNKSARTQRVTLTNAKVSCSAPGAKLEFLGPDSNTRAAKITCKNGKPYFTLPGETLFALRWEGA
jgi:hypothetical protein